MHLPQPRGPSSTAVVEHLRQPSPGSDAQLRTVGLERSPGITNDEDRLLALWVLQGLNYHGYSGVDPEIEWDLAVVQARTQLEAELEEELLAAFTPVVEELLPEARRDLTGTLFSLPDRVAASAPSMSAWARSSMTAEQWREMLVLRSASQLKEADPHTFAVPRIPGRAKVALMEIQFDEYGSGDPSALHSELFAQAMTAVGLDHSYGGYADTWPAPVLLSNVTLGWFAGRSRWAPAVVGHLTMVEMTSSLPSKFYVAGARRLGLPEEAWRYFDEHVEADAAHEQVAVRDVCGALVADDPDTLPTLLVGAVAGLHVEGLVAELVMGAWEQGRSALRIPLHPWVAA
ncbi:iron-containing redox enzyme family protein [Ornithinimicrobium sufpigmenti]|uniref:iron-containing redox enzyme family protein n=1 Tax=Ornithinimicrobium sufpigmenti TaxID=2508882 RepID=UPI001EE0981C|nr:MULTISPECIES: iron-containing redox enzyme family protein [unclassified Ornithinimicrobium]